MLPDRVSNPGTLTYESGALPIALCSPALSTIIFGLPKREPSSLRNGRLSDILLGY